MPKDFNSALAEIYLHLKAKWPQLNVRHLKRTAEALNYLQQIGYKNALFEALNYGFTQSSDKKEIRKDILNQLKERGMVKEDISSFEPKAQVAILKGLGELIAFLSTFAQNEGIKNVLLLLSRLLKHRQEVVRTLALKTAFFCIPSQMIREIILEELKEQLNAPYWRIRELSTRCLGEIYQFLIRQGEGRYLKTLEELLRHPDWHVRKTAASVLAETYCLLLEEDEGKYLTSLLRLLADPQSEIVLAALAQLKRAFLKSIQEGKWPDLTPIENLLTEKDLNICTAAIEALAEIYAALITKQREVDLHLLENMRHSPYGRVRERIAIALGKIYLAFFKAQRSCHLGCLESLLFNEDWRVRIAAINAIYPIYLYLVQEGQNPSFEKLEVLLKDRYSPVTNAAANALGKVCAQEVARGNTACLQRLKGMLDSKDWYFSRKISIALAQVYGFLAQRGDENAFKELEKMLDDADFYVCIVALSALTTIYKKMIERQILPALDKIELLLEHPKIYVRISAISSLAEIYATLAIRGKMDYLNDLEAWLESEDPDMIKAAADNLLQVYAHFIEQGEKKYLTNLEKMLSLKEDEIVQGATKVLTKAIAQELQDKELKQVINRFEQALNKSLDTPLKGSFASAIRIKEDEVILGDLVLKRKKKTLPSPCVFTATGFQMLKTIALAYLLKHPLLLLGPTSTGKSFLVKWLASLLGYEHLSYTLNPYSSKFELIGGIKPDKKGRFKWQDGVILKAAKEGKWLVLEEINLASSEVIEVLNDYLTTGYFIYSQDGKQKRLKPHPDFRLFATANPESYAGRQKLSQVFLSRWQIYYQNPLSEQEIAEILSSLFSIPASFALVLARFHRILETQAEARLIGKEERDSYIFSLRDIIRLGKRIEWLFQRELTERELLSHLFSALYGVYLARIRDKTEKEALMALLDTHFGFKIKGLDLKTMIEAQGRRLRSLMTELKVTKGNNFIPQEEGKITPTKSQKITLSYILTALLQHEPVLLVGMPASGKTTLLRYLAREKGTNLFYINLSSDTSLEELLGGYVQDDKGKWRYRPGLLFEAVEKGFWLLIDEANLNPLSEYLNTLIDFGYLMSEEGRVYKAHPNFRLFLAINPPRIHGSRNLLSPSLRSRFFEIWVDEPTDKAELDQMIRNWMGQN